jgi:uncharacterized membrane protein AbrB (regulator of aidB expression)
LNSLPIALKISLRPWLSLVVSAAGALVCDSLGAAVPWTMGAMIAMALASTANLPVARPPITIAVGQVVIGTALGLFFTHAALTQMGALLGYLIAAALFAFVIGILCARAETQPQAASRGALQL